MLEKEFEVALADLSKAEQDVKEKRLAVLTYEQKVEESKRLLCASETRLAELKKNVESVREKVFCEKKSCSCQHCFCPLTAFRFINRSTKNPTQNTRNLRASWTMFPLSSRLCTQSVTVLHALTTAQVICKESRKLAEKFKEETMEMKLQRLVTCYSSPG